MNVKRTFYAGILTLGLSAHAFGAAGMEPGDGAVGRAGDINALVIEGVTAYEPAAIRRELRMNPEVLLATHPQAPLSELPGVLEQRIRLGYLNGGFPDAAVSVRLDPDRGWVVAVSEGARFVAGDVKVPGARALLSAHLMERLTKPLAKPAAASSRGGVGEAAEGAGGSIWKKPLPELALVGTHLGSHGEKSEVEEPLWSRGKTVSFAPFWRHQAEVRIRRFLAELGFFFPKFDVELVRTDGNAADLVVTIHEEGAPGVIGQIEISGLEKNRREDLLEYLDLRPGMEINVQRIAQTEYLLWRAARFWHHDVATHWPDPSRPEMTLRISVEEFDQAPALTEPFTVEQQALLRVCDWLSSYGDRDEDLVFVMGPEEVDFPWASGLGLTIIVDRERGTLILAETAGAEPEISGALILGRDRMALHEMRRGRKLEVPLPSWEVSANLISIPPPRDSSEEPSITLALGGKSSARKNRDGAPPVSIGTMLAPVMFVYAAGLDEGNPVVRDGVLIFSGEQVAIEADAETGRILSGPIRFERGAFEAALSRIESASASHEEILDSKRPIASLLGFLVERLLALSMEERVEVGELTSGLTALQTIFAGGALDPVEALLRRSPEGDGEEFDIPTDVIEPTDAGVKRLMASVAGIAFGYADQLFPKQSWPWTLAHEAVFILSGDTAYTEEELARIYFARETGPVGNLVIAEALARFAPALTRRFAVQGLARSSAVRFREDWLLLTDGEPILAEAASRVTDSVRQLSREELAAIASLSPSWGGALEEIQQGLATNPGLPLSEALEPALDAIWERWLRRYIEARLTALLNKHSLSDP